MIEKIALVALGGALGAVLRFLSVAWVARLTGEAAWGTMAVNVAGSAVMGVLAVLLLDRAPETARWAPFALTGVLGGFTTFSAFSLDTLRLWEAGRMAATAGYVGGSVALSILGLVAGVLVARAALA